MTWSCPDMKVGLAQIHAGLSRHLADHLRPVEGMAVAFTLMIAISPQAEAQDQGFGLPVDCTIGETCFIQNYFDVDLSTDSADFICGGATYDGHKGTDIRVPNMAAVADNIAVVAAADGTVVGVRDSMEDGPLTEAKRTDIKGKECGNGTVIDHGNGWQTQYCHLRRGSVDVSPGDDIKAGAPIGMIGQSGLAEFPHVHFEIRKDGVPIDPFTGRTAGAECGHVSPDVVNVLWTEEAKEAVHPPKSAIIASGFAPEGVESNDLVSQQTAWPEPDADWPAMVYYVQTINLKAGDVQELVLITPDGREARSEIEPLDRTKAQYLVFAGRKRPDGGWPSGTYRATYKLIRNGETLLEKSAETEL